MTVERDVVTEALLQALPEAVAQRAHALHWRQVARKLTSLAEADREQGALRPGAPSGFVRAAMDQRFERDAATHEQGADTFRCINLVSGNRQQIDAEFVDVGLLLQGAARTAIAPQLLGVSLLTGEEHPISLEDLELGLDFLRGLRRGRLAVAAAVVMDVAVVVLDPGLAGEDIAVTDNAY